MFAVKWESCVAVVKLSGFPVGVVMTFQAIGFTVNFKLFVMFIFVAFRAVACQYAEALHPLTVFQCFEMAVAAAFVPVPARQLETGCLVVELNFCPFVHIVAVSATGFSIILFIDVGLVNIIMTVSTFTAGNFEIPFFFFSMADKTRCGHVRTFQLKACAVVLPDAERKRGKTRCGVTISAIGYMPVLFYKLTFVVILVAIRTAAVAEVVCQFCFVTCFAVHRPVLVLQFEIGFVVVERR